MATVKLPFTISKRKDSKYFSVRFKDEKTGRYLPALSTRQTDRDSAIKTAWAWYSQGKIKSEKKERSLETLSLYDEIRKSDITDEEALKMLDLLKRKGIIKSYVKTGSKNDILFSDYLLNFWTWEKSEYIQDKLKEGKSIGKTHIKENYNRIKNDWLPFFKDKLLGEITRQDLKDFSAVIQKRNIANSTKNKIWLAGTQALRYAFNNELIERDITGGLTSFHGKSKEREILTPEMVQAIFTVDWQDEKARLANILAMCTGLRAGEIRALQKKDLGVNCLYINHSWNDLEGLKSTKNGESRIVQLPFPQLSEKLLELAETNPYDKTMNAFIFYATIPNKPIEAHFFLDGLRGALEKVGMKKTDTKNYCFHAWRHFYASYMADHISTKLLQSQTGHKTTAMLEHYSNHRIAGDDEQIQNAQISLFGGIVNNAHIHFDTKKLYHNVKTEYMNKSGLYEHSRQER
jgi:integrase